MSNLTSVVNVIVNGTSFNGTASPVAGITGTFGDSIIMAIAAITIMLIIGWKMKAPPDLIAVSCLSMIIIVSSPTLSTAGANLLADWVFWLFLLAGGAVLGLGLLKVLKIR